MGSQREAPRRGVPIRQGLTVDPPVHEEAPPPRLCVGPAMPIRGEGTLAPLTDIPARTLRGLERNRCPPPREHVPPQWLLDLIRERWDAKTILVALHERLQTRDPETTFEMALSILRSLGGASTDGRVLREMMTAEQLRRLLEQRRKRHAG